MSPAKKPGDNIIFRLKRNENQQVLDWINAQSNISDSLRFLIELEILRNGIKDFQEVIPPKRSEKFLLEYLKQEISNREEIERRILEMYSENDETDNDKETYTIKNEREQEPIHSDKTQKYKEVSVQDTVSFKEEEDNKFPNETLETVETNQDNRITDSNHQTNNVESKPKQNEEVSLLEKRRKEEEKRKKILEIAEAWKNV